MRARVNERLERAARFPVTLIAAPAGFGKSVALRDFLASGNAQALRCDFRREDAGLLAFVRRLCETLEPVAPSALAAFPALQERVLAGDEPVRQLSDWFAEHLRGISCTIALDDLHDAAADQASIALLADLVERSIPSIRWIVAARGDMGLPVASWIAYGHMDLPVGEDDLRFTAQEALTVAEAGGSSIDPPEIESLRAFTEGWAAALVIALRTRTLAADLRSAASGTREMIYRYLAEQVFSTLDAPERDFALASCVFSSFDAQLAAALGASETLLRSLRAKALFLSERDAGVYRYHDLFREFLETELRRRGEPARQDALRRGARLLEDRGEDALALALYGKAGAHQEVLALLERAGLALFERGQGDALSAAIDAIPEHLRRTHAPALGLRAVLAASRGHFDLAQRSFVEAIDLAQADHDLRVSLVHRYAIQLVRHDRDAIALLEPLVAQEALPASLRVPVLGTLATAHARAGSNHDAVACIERALALLDRSVADAERARFYQQAAHVYEHAGRAAEARSHARAAIDLALRGNLYDVAARAYSVEYALAYEEDGDPDALLEIVNSLDECARKGASVQSRSFALLAAYEIESERGDDRALERLDAALAQAASSIPRGHLETLLPARALRAAWLGDFQAAHDLLDGTTSHAHAQDRRSLRAAEIALYAFACARTQAGTEALQEAIAALERCSVQTRRTVRARAFLALAELVRGHPHNAHRHLTEAERALARKPSHTRALITASRALYRIALEQEDRAEISAVLQRLRGEHLGGLARLIEVLPFAAPETSAYGSLTSSEREILALLARGASTKEVARRTSRSPHTVDTHIRSICRKLQCRGRREAVALATSRGWVET